MTWLTLFMTKPCDKHSYTPQPKEKEGKVMWKHNGLTTSLTSLWFFEDFIVFLLVPATFEEVNLGVLVMLEVLETAGFRIDFNSWLSPTRSSANLWFKWSGVQSISRVEHTESWSAPDTLGFRVRSLLKECRLSLYRETGSSSGTKNLVFFKYLDSGQWTGNVFRLGLLILRWTLRT